MPKTYASTSGGGSGAGVSGDPRATPPSAPALSRESALTGVPHILDNPALAALEGPHAHLAERRGRIVRYPLDVSPWIGLPPDPGPRDWADLAALYGPDREVPLPGVRAELPEGWSTVSLGEGVQLVDDGVEPAHDPETVRLGPADVPEMLDLVARTRPGPFLPRTIELGTYLGIRRDGALIAMAGERLRPPGWTEISAVCTDPAHRGQGLAARLVRAVAAGIADRGESPFMHASAGNTDAIRIYLKLGFALRRTAEFGSIRTPAAVGEASRAAVG
ncbi:GNAT family N-acetyltransferase [Streptomyces sp. JNUCC 64]